MFDIGWPELLVVAIVLIVVVGPKDLPPMLRAFGRTTKKLKSMANEFRGQFDDALREAELGDVKKTFDEAKKLNPMQSIRDAVNPLKDTAKEIRSDLEKSVKAPSAAAADQPKVEIPQPTMKLADGPPVVKPADPAPAVAGAPAEPAQKPASSAKSVAAAKKPGAKTAASKPAKAPAPAQSKQASPKTAAKPNPAPAKATAAAKPATKAKTTSAAKAPAPAKSAPRARKPKQGEGQA